MLLEEQTWFKSGGLKPDSDSYWLLWPETVSLFLWRQELIILKRDRKHISFCSTMSSSHVSLHFLFLLKSWTKKLIELWPKIRVHLMYELGRGVSMLIDSRFLFLQIWRYKCSKYVRKWKWLSCVWLTATPWTIQSMEFSRPQHWSMYPFPSPGDLPNPGIEPTSPPLQVDSLQAEPDSKYNELGT